MTEYTPNAKEVREEYVYGAQEVDLDGNVVVSFDEACARWDRFLARIRRDAWDACYHQMATAPARGVTVVPQSNPYAPERRETP